MNDLKNLKWLLGQWEGTMGSGIYHEEWNETNKYEMKGRAYLEKNGEITNNENLKIHKIENDIFYTADVSHNPAPVSFKLTESSDIIFVFENPGHDFPQKITYELKNSNNFIASAEAVKDGKIRKLIFDLKRIA